ncbi:MAG: thioredoxin domain-containing protein [Myxococcaceae bacterium]|jgi:protein-disulfide isomerase|nr:thioredoxin domain-containing protein [Myxococcaceae bacterium]
MSRVALFVVAVCACATPPKPSPTPLDVGGVDPAVARIGARTILQSEVDRRAGDEFLKLQDQLYELRTDTAERIAVEGLVEAEAKREGVDADAWLEQRVEPGLREPTEGELQELFARVKRNLPEASTYADVRPQLRRALQREGRMKRARELFDELKRRAGYEVVLAPPARPRKQVDATGPSRGPSSARVVIVEFADFQCSFCARASDTVKKVAADFPADVRVVFRHFPLANHPLAPKAAEASACANEQGRFWEFHDHLFANMRELDESSLKAHALTLGLDLRPFVACLESGRMRAVVEQDRAAGEKLGVNGTPAFFINGVMLSGAQPEEAFRKAIERELGR